MAVLESVAELEALLIDRPDRTRTYQIDPSIAREMHEVIQAAASAADTRVMNPAEVEELAGYLEVPVRDLQGPLTVSDLACSGCGRRLTIYDIAKTSVDDGIHAKSRLAAVLSGKAGYWVTVRGKDGGRYANCAACDRQSDLPVNSYSCDLPYAWA